MLGNFSGYLRLDSVGQSKFIFDWGLLSRAAFFIYFAGFGVPLAIAVLMRSLGKKVKPVKVICIYGYGYSVYVIAM
jgi:hypothetical protein